MSVSLTKEIVAKYISDPSEYIFVETGTYEGGGVQLALDLGFSKVFSIDINPEMVAKCNERFADLLGTKVFLYEGDTSVDLYSMLEDVVSERIVTRLVYWLDAHFQWDGPAGLERVPLLKELDQINDFGFDEDDVIFIDDRRLMGVDFWGTTPEAMVMEAVEHLESYMVYPQVSYENTVHAEKDIIVVVGVEKKESED